MSDQPVTDLYYRDLPLDESLQQGIRDAGFERCTPIQAQTLPLALRGEDVAGQALTGTGKTAAFLVACMNLLLEREPRAGHTPGHPRAMILAPTRELAVQIHKDALTLGAHTGLRFGLVFGGTGYHSQRETLEDGIDILIGTPGRFIDYYKQGVFGLDGVQVAILDEADRMFDLGFIKDIRYLLRRLPPPAERVNMLFSATLSMRVMELAYEHMNEPQLINASPEDVTVEHVTQVLYHVSKEEKLALLIGRLRHMDVTRTIVFANTKRVTELLVDYLNFNGFVADVLSGDVPQPKRLQLLQRFQSGQLPILVATDVAARGLHIPAVSHVFNFDLPQDAEDYVHRIGRTARAGAHGDAVSFACDEFVYSLPDIEAYISAAIPAEAVTDDMLADIKHPPRRPRRPAPGRRDGGRRDGGGRRDTGGGPRRGPRPPREAAAVSPTPAPPPAPSAPAEATTVASESVRAASGGVAAASPGGAADAPRKKRRRRPRRRTATETAGPSSGSGEGASGSGDAS